MDVERHSTGTGIRYVHNFHLNNTSNGMGLSIRRLAYPGWMDKHINII